MISPQRLAWLQLRRQKMRFLVAVAGVAFAVILMFMQLGFMDALFRSAVNVHRRLAGDLVMTDPRYTAIVRPSEFPARRVEQARAFPGVVAVAPIQAGVARWRNPDSASLREIFVLGADPTRTNFTVPELNAQMRDVRYADRVLFDADSRPEYGPIAARFSASRPVVTEVNGREIEVEGLFQFGTSFGIDGTIITSDLNYRRLFPAQPAGAVTLALVRLAPDADPEAVRDAMNAHLPGDVEVRTMAEFIGREIRFWATGTPVGFIFSFGVVMGIVVGMIIVYQILFSDVTDHLQEYATLKAMGRTNGWLARVVLVEATVLATVGFLPGVVACWWLYGITQSATRLPMEVEGGRALLVFGLTILMCWGSGLLALRKLRTANPADVF
jgi:putative ABC transport system permease protein